MTVICFATTFVYYAAWLSGVRQVRDINTKLDSENLTCSDYAIQLTGLPTESLDEEDFLMQICKNKPEDPKVIRSVFVYDLKEHLKINAELAKLKKQKQLILAYRKSYAKMMRKKGQMLTETELKEIYPPGENLCICCWKSIGFEYKIYFRGRR